MAMMLTDALAPTNFPWSNPTVIKAIVDQGGGNLARGLRNLLQDFPRLPSTVDTSKFAVGENLATTPGSVVLRTEVFELIQYAPQTEQVREVPLLFAPPTINKYYILDLAPGRSMIEWLVQQGQQVFTISWRNPGVEQGHFDFDTYADAVLEAREAVAAHHRTADRSPQRRLLRRHPRRRGPRPPRCGRAGSESSRASRCWSARSTTLGPAPPRRSPGARSRRPPSPNRPAAATSTGRRSQACSRGCGRTTSSGTTWSTTICSASSRPRSTSCTGIRTPCGSRPACTATSSTCRSRTR